MKLTMIMSAVILFGQVNIALAAKVTPYNVDKVLSMYYRGTSEKPNLDALADEVRNKKSRPGAKLVDSIKGALDSASQRIGISGASKVVTEMPSALTVIAFIDLVNRRADFKGSIESKADPKDVEFARLLTAVLNKMADKIEPNSTTKSAMNNLLGKAVNLQENVTPFLKDVLSHLEGGASLDDAFRKAAKPRMDAFNRNPETKAQDRVSSLDEYVKKIELCPL